MGRKKKRPHRSGRVPDKHDTGAELDDEIDDVEDAQVFVDVDWSCWVLDEHRDISEVLLTDLTVEKRGFLEYMVDGQFYEEARFTFRFRISNVNKSFRQRIKLGHWPVLSGNNLSVELIEKNTSEVVLSGKFDGTDDGLTGLVHLCSLKFMSLRPVLGFTISEKALSLRLRVGILSSAFDSCETLLDNTRQPWRKSMMNVMAWLRPEVMTSEIRYGESSLTETKLGLQGGDNDNATSEKQTSFDVAGFYEAIKQSKENPLLENDIPGLLPKLRPYQRRAAHWMVQREKGPSNNSGEQKISLSTPVCVNVDFVDTFSSMFYNPFSGSVSMHKENSSDYICGGILADEMGLGKTVELLACIFAHKKSESEDDFSDYALGVSVVNKKVLRRVKKERVECVCGSVTESRKYKGLWVQCDMCDSWQHADCVGYSPRENKSKSKVISDIVVTGEEFVCQLCSELIKAIDSPVPTGATLIVCPAPILHQWHAEILRHTKPGSLKTYVYEGVKNSSSNAAIVDISEFIDADIVLTTYDVLREDLSHDTDRHEGDRHIMRFQKRYPVIPTLLTRIFWWRVCLDEAQMVESNTANATEMALRLHAKHRWCITGTPIQRKLDDLYGLLRFLRASPYDTFRWWIEVIRDPYEKRDSGAMIYTHKLFKQIMWRSSKAHVSDELQLPPQEECLSWLSFSPIEEHFYRRQHETCVSYAHEVVETYKDDNVKGENRGYDSADASFNPYITQNEASKLLNSLLKLRQACCHPQVGSSGMRSLQQSPMTMEEILEVLVGKTKIEGEEALRRLVTAMNGLAGIAIIKQDFCEAVLFYKEALALTEEHSEDFRLDPLLNLHIHHNLTEILPIISEYDEPVTKRLKVNRNGFSVLNAGREKDINVPLCSRSSHDESLRITCDEIKKKYLSAFSSRLALAQQDFRKTYMQVCKALDDKKDLHEAWWLEALQHIDQNLDSSNELIKKIGDAISGSSKSSNSKLDFSFRSISALKCYIQASLDALEASRKHLVDRILEVDQTMEEPKEEDIERVRYCPNCQVIGDGPICVHCELDELFQVYEARLFRLNKERGGMVASAEEAIDLQKKNSALNRFYWNLSQPDKHSTSSGNDIAKDKKRRDAGEKVVVSKSPSELEVVLGVIKNYSRYRLGREGTSAATNQMVLLEGMRKEYTHARSLAISQAQVLRAHDEIKMAASRLRLREDENDKSVDVLSVEELEEASVDFTHGKLTALTSLSTIQGQLRYLKGLVKSKQNSPSDSFKSLDAAASSKMVQADEDECPVCQEKLSKQKMVFQCGHTTCCKCFFAMTDKTQHNRAVLYEKWIMCPTCRQQTNIENVAYANDEQDKLHNSSMPPNNSEAFLTIRGSYGTKIEAITRRILWIKSQDPKAKVLVFTSWNDVLDVLEHALTANDVIYTRMKGGRKSHVAISHFRGQNVPSATTESKCVQVLLLLIQHGANGLNLLEAQHVILVEPLLNPAAEAQAISRVHRIGQEKKTRVHRFLVKHTVEEGIYKLNRGRSADSFISGNKKNQNEPVLTLKDVESLFSEAPSSNIVPPESNENENSRRLTHLPPSVAAGIAAQRRLDELNTTT